MPYEVFGFLAVFLLATSGVPQLIRLLSYKKSSSISPYSILCVFFGCVFMIIFLVKEDGVSIFQLNYYINALISLTNLFLYFKYKKNT